MKTPIPVLSLMSCLLLNVLTAAEPNTPEQSLQHLRLADDRLKIELVASEPAVIDPVAAQFDENGRLWVVEMRDYPHGPPPGEAPKSRIKIVEDTDRDGQFETVHIFADELLFATELLPWKGGAIVTMAGEVVYLKDSDGDSRADVRQTWFRGFAQENSQLRANHPRLGLDGWIYVANGLRGGSVVDAMQADSKPVSLAGKDFRFHPDTRQYQAVTGIGQFGLTFDEFGRRFICSNRNPLMHVVLEESFLQRNPLYAPPSARHDVGKAGEESRIYPISRAWTTSNLHAGQFTAACGVLVFRGDGLPDDYRGNGFTCDPTGNLVHREVIEPAGATFDGRVADGMVEFLASTDEWFRPVNLFLGPDGALYVVDMYRAVIEHPDFMPDELKRRPDLLLGTERGRIYRISAKTAPALARPQLSEASAGKIVELLSQPGWFADTAMRLLSESKDRSAIDALSKAAVSAPPGGAVRALWLLQGMNALPDEVLSRSLRHADARVREQAVLLVDARRPPIGAWKRQVMRLSNDPDPRVRFCVLMALAPAESAEEVDAIQQVAWLGISDPWTRRAAVVAAGGHAGTLVKKTLANPPWHSRAPMAGEIELLRELTTAAARSSEDGDIATLLQSILELQDKASARVQRQLLHATAEALGRRGRTLRQIAEQLPAMTFVKRLEAAFAAADTVASHADAPTDERIEAIELLAHDPQYSEALMHVALNKEASPQYPLAMRVRAVQGLGRTEDGDAFRQLLAQWPRESAAFRRALLDVLLARADRVTVLLDELATGNVRPGELETSYVNRLLKQGPVELRQRAEKLLASAIPADRQKVLADYQPVLKMQADPKRGREVFAKNCATCHRIGELGVNVAPDISDSRVKLAEQILTDILQPNRAIDNNYLSYTVLTTDGLSLTGIVTTETGNSITLRQQEGKEVTLLRSNIDEIRSNGISLMPDGLERNIPPQEMADLISFIKNWRYLDGRTPLGEPGS